MDVMVNETTGLHVHISPCGRAFILDEVKAIAKWIVIFEGSVQTTMQPLFPN